MFCLVIFTLISVISRSVSTEDLKLVVVTVATEPNDGYHRFMRSAKIFGYQVEVLGMGERWLGGDMEAGAGGGHKINLLSEGLKKYKNDNNTVLMFTDSYDVILAAEPSEVMKKFQAMKANVIFSAEDFCWPDKSLASKYPVVETGYKYLCSGGIIGYAAAFYQLLTSSVVANTDDDQLYYTKIYLELRETLALKLDHRAEIFQNLHGNGADVALAAGKDGSGLRISNERFTTMPVVVHGNGPTKDYLSHLGNYLAKTWTFEDGCVSCSENSFSLADLKEEEWPQILIGLFIEAPTPFVPAYLEHIANQDYPKKKIDIFIHNVDPYHHADVEAWMKKYSDQYKSITLKDPRTFLKESEARNMGMKLCGKLDCDFYLSVDASVTLNNRKALQLLLQQNRTFLVPIMSKPGKLWSNFWGEVTDDGYYARSPDYIDIVKNNRRGVWNSPFVSGVYLIHSSTLERIPASPFGMSSSIDMDVEFCNLMRKQGIFMYATNMHHFGHLKEAENYTTNFKHNDMYQLFDNKLDWEDQYLHPNFTNFLAPDSKQLERCPDVYWFPFVTTNFTQHLIEECEHFGKWSGGKHQDKRISGGYENVPTVDIHMNQIGFEKHWLQMLKDYIAPLATRNYPGYHSYSHSIMNFVVKYTMDGQYFLRPHHDASTFTINLALNEGYLGGGARFLRYNCSVVGSDMKAGWSLMHPGRLTHQHEGLPLINATRYIMISFVDP